MRKPKPAPDMNPMRFLGVGVTWALSTALFLYLGMLVDARLDSKPVFSLVGALIGAVGGFYYVYRQSLASIRRPDDET